jgi:hypothetical protein
MNIRRKGPQDSLYLLLDTLCNTFGGIILLAVLVTLLTSKEKQAQSEMPTDSRELMERRVALAEKNLEESRKLSTALKLKADSDRSKEQIKLLQIRGESQTMLQQARDAIAENSEEVETLNAEDPSERLKFLNTQLISAKNRKAEAENARAAAKENSEQLKRRLVGMEAQVTTKIQESQRPLRLPKEHQTEKNVRYIIARYDLIYPCRNFDLSRNEQTINWRSNLLEGQRAEPLPGKGLNPVRDSRELQRYFSGQSTENVYFVFCVFEDSFGAFIRAKQLAVAAGLAYGWEPFRIEDGDVTFVENGRRPKPQ